MRPFVYRLCLSYLISAIWMNMSTQKGDLYEDLLSNTLVSQGWIILAKYIGGGGEIDIIAIREGELCFIEVKGRDDIHGGYDSIFTSMTKKSKEH